MKTVVTKGEYARLKNRAPSAVSNWIADGRISAAALIGEGNRSRIWVEQADADLARNLDPAQQAAQAAPIAPSLAPRQEPPAPAASDGAEVIEFRPSARAAAMAVEDEDVRRRRKADADAAEHDAEAKRRRNAVDEGRWIDSATAQREWGRELARILADVETFLAGPLARSLADKYALDWKEISVEARRLFRAHRSEQADAAAGQRRAIEEAEPLAAE